MMEEIEKLCDRLELARYRTDLGKECKSERRSHRTIGRTRDSDDDSK